MRRALLLLACLGCGGGVVQRVDALPPAPPGKGFLAIHVTPPDVDLYLGDAFMGRVDGYAQGVVRLPIGTHRVTLQRAGYYPHHALVHVDEAGQSLTVALVPRI